LSGQVLEAFKIDSFPTYIVLDKDGVMRFRQSGFGEGTEGELDDAINKALKRPSNRNLFAVAAASANGAESLNNEPSSINALSTPRAGNEADADTRGAKTELASDSSALFGIEGGIISAGTYKNEALSFAYEFPRGWIAAKPEALHILNERLEASAKASILQQHPEASGNFRIMTPKIIFYASRRGDGDGQRLSFPCVRITATPSRASSLDSCEFIGADVLQIWR